MNSRILHILKSPPDEVVSHFIEEITGDGGASVFSLYRDDIADMPVDWSRLVDDIFNHELVICWW